MLTRRTFTFAGLAAVAAKLLPGTPAQAGPVDPSSAGSATPGLSTFPAPFATLSRCTKTTTPVVIGGRTTHVAYTGTVVGHPGCDVRRFQAEARLHLVPPVRPGHVRVSLEMDVGETGAWAEFRVLDRVVAPAP